MRSQTLPIICLTLFLLLFFVIGCGGGSAGNSGGGNPDVLIVNSTLTTIKIQADIPPMEVKHQTLIAVTIYPTGAVGKVSEAPVIKNATAIVTEATPLGTPGKTLVNAFGPNHTVTATATLETSPDLFTVATGSPITQTKPLDQPTVQWNWFVTPQVDGNQFLGVDIEVQWTSTLTGKQGLPYTLGFPKFPVSVQGPPAPTPTPAPKPDPLAITNAILPPLAQILVAIIGAIGLVLAALIALPNFRAWLKARFKRPTSKSKEE
ncbi:MAG: hypothetical protein NVSMB38_44000 [Ktedonobacteraceae bacterium]